MIGDWEEIPNYDKNLNKMNIEPIFIISKNQEAK